MVSQNLANRGWGNDWLPSGTNRYMNQWWFRCIHLTKIVLTALDTLIYIYISVYLKIKQFKLDISLWGQCVKRKISVMKFLMFSCKCLDSPSAWYAAGRSGSTHWGRDEIAAISQTTFSNTFSWKKMHEFRLRFHWSLFLRVHLIIFQHWFR